MMKKVAYYPELDGIRAVAVCFVVLYHLGFTWIKGGFVGVDIFFVISGYLITIILINQESSEFNLIDFYVRRIKRIMPALVVTMMMCYAVALIAFTPSDMDRFNSAYFFSLTGVSNFYLWSESGYFDRSSYLKPDLHTWSLSVELQFYLIWAVFILLLKRLNLKRQFGVFLLIILVSLIGNIYALYGSYLPRVVLENRASTIFYLTPFRIFEFAIGGGSHLFILAWANP